MPSHSMDMSTNHLLMFLVFNDLEGNYLADPRY